jgi:hypothetical protein
VRPRHQNRKAFGPEGKGSSSGPEPRRFVVSSNAPSSAPCSVGRQCRQPPRRSNSFGEITLRLNASRRANERISSSSALAASSRWSARRSLIRAALRSPKRRTSRELSTKRRLISARDTLASASSTDRSASLTSMSWMKSQAASSRSRVEAARSVNVRPRMPRLLSFMCAIASATIFPCSAVAARFTVSIASPRTQLSS